MRKINSVQRWSPGALNLNTEVKSVGDSKRVRPKSKGFQGEVAGDNFGELGKTQANMLVRSEILRLQVRPIRKTAIG